MQLSSQKIKKLCQRQGLTLNKLLKRAKVSRTAYYHLLRQEDLLPKTVRALANALKVKSSSLTSEETAQVYPYRKLFDQFQKILKKHPEADPENVWHALLLFQEKPFERLKRGLLRAQKFNFYR